MQAGKKVGLSTVLVLSGKSKKEDVSSWDEKPDYILDDLLAAAEMILEGER